MSSVNTKENKNTTKIKNNITNNSNSIDNDLRLKTVFNSFVSNNSNDFSEPHCISKVSTKKNEIFQNIYTKRKIVNSLFNMKNSLLIRTNSQKPISLKYFEFGLKKLFFGPEGYITNKISYLRKIYKKKRKKSVGLNTRIYTGCLDYLDLKNKNSMTNRVDEVKKKYIKQSSNFAVAEGQNDVIYAKLLSKLSQKKNNNYSLINFNSTSSTYIINKMKINKTKLTDSHELLYSDLLLSKPISPINSPIRKKKKKIKISLNNSNLKKTRYFSSSNSNKILSNLTNANHYNTDDIISKTKKKISPNLIKKTKNELASKIKLIQEKIYNDNKDINLNPEESKRIKKFKEKNDKINKIKKNIELVTNVKIVDKKTKQKAKFILKNGFQGPKANIYKSSIFRYTEAIDKINSDTAFKFGNGISNNYNEEVHEDDLVYNEDNFLPKKNNYNKNLRKHCNLNSEKIKHILNKITKFTNKNKVNEEI